MLFPNFAFERVFILLFIVLGVVRALASAKKSRRRRTPSGTLDEVSLQYGWKVSRPVTVYQNFLFFKIPLPDKTSPVDGVTLDWLNSLDSRLFPAGQGYVSVVISGTHDGSVFRALQYVIPGGKNDPTEYYSVVLVPSDRNGAKVTVQQETLLTRVADAATDSDIDFEDEEFSKTYKVTSPDRKEAYAVISQEVIEMVKVLAPDRLSWAPGCLIWSRRETLDADVVASVLPHLTKIALSKQ